MPSLTPEELARERARALKNRAEREAAIAAPPPRRSGFRDFNVGTRQRRPLDDPEGDFLPPRTR